MKQPRKTDKNTRLLNSRQAPIYFAKQIDLHNFQRGIHPFLRPIHELIPAHKKKKKLKKTSQHLLAHTVLQVQTATPFEGPQGAQNPAP